MSVSISPVFNGFQFFDNDGFPLSGGLLFQYEAQSDSVMQDTFTTPVGDVPNENPIVFDSSGRIVTDLWLTDGLFYHFVITMPDGTTVLDSIDNVTGVKASQTPGTEPKSIWTLAEALTSYVSPNQFIIEGNFTQQFSPGNRVQIEDEDGSFVYGTVTSRTFSNPNTMVTLVMDNANNIPTTMINAYWSQNTVSGSTIDAGAVAYTVPSQYTNPKTVGYQIVQAQTNITSANTRIDSTYKVHTTVGGGGTYLVTIPGITGYDKGQHFTVRFHVGAGSGTINVNGLGAVNIYQYTFNGSKRQPIIADGMVASLGFDGADFIMLDQLPPEHLTNPHGCQVFSSNGVFTTPADVSTIKVTIVGGGGGGGPGATFGGGGESGSTNVPGGAGGNGGSGVRTLATQPGLAYGVSIGAGGAGGLSNISGAPGGTSVFGNSLVVATGGNGGFISITTPVPGDPGYGSVADYGYYGVGFQIGNDKRGVGGAGAANYYAQAGNGTPGMCIVEW